MQGFLTRQTAAWVRAKAFYCRNRLYRIGMRSAERRDSAIGRLTLSDPLTVKPFEAMVPWTTAGMARMQLPRAVRQ